MDYLTIASGPIIGSMIGYVTNFIAVKMLFRPLYPVKIGDWTLPFTPGIFPKRKEQLAKALGNAVGNNLLTSEDVKNMFLKEDSKEVIVKEIWDFFDTEDSEHTLKNSLAPYVSQESYQRAKYQLEELIIQKIMSGLARLEIGDVIVKEGSRALKEKTQGSMLGVLVNDKWLVSLATPIGQKIEEYVNENGPDIIRSIIQDEVLKLENQPIGYLVKDMGLKEEHIREMAEKIYTHLQLKIEGFIKQFDIAGVVEQKVRDMDVLEIEKLVLTVMKNELNAIVNLGAVIGFALGLLNIFL